MTRQQKQRIIEQKRVYLRHRHPTFNESEINSFAFYDKTDTTANGLTSCVCDYLKFAGWQAERINTMGVARANYKIDPHTGKRIGDAVGVTWTKGGSTPGSADISATIHGRSVKIEVKMKDRQSEAQKQYQQAIEAAGGQYWLIHNMTEFFQQYDFFITKIREQGY